MSLFQQLNHERGITIVLVTHEHDIAEYAKRVIVMSDGRDSARPPVDRRRDAAAELAKLPAPEVEVAA